MYETAEQCWSRLSGTREGVLQRVERYASLTIPKVCLPEGFDHDNTDQTHDYQSIGAQAVNNLTNKAMLALFAPSRPFFRVGTGPTTTAQMQQNGIPDTDVAPILASMEREAVKALDNLGQRPKLYSVMRHLIVAGNVLMHLDHKAIRVMGLRYYCVKRDYRGDIHTLIIKEKMKFDELEDTVKQAVTGKYHDDTEVSYYRYFRRLPSGDMGMSQWVDSHRLPTKFDGKWPEDRFPYRVLTWDLADDADYGTGLVEEYAGDLEALSILSESVVDGAVLGSEFRWLVSPTGQTSIEDVNDSKNGDALAGRPEDIQPTQAGNSAAIQVADGVLQRYERRISMGFLMMTGSTRQAERVTAEEIRIQAFELETAYGGVYSSLANNTQGPIARWLLDDVGVDLHATDLTVSIITGLDALSRNGDLENLRMAFSDLASITAATMQDPQLSARIKWEPLAKFVGDGRGCDLTPFLKSDQEVQQDMAQNQQARVAEASATAAGEAVAQGTQQ